MKNLVEVVVHDVAAPVARRIGTFVSGGLLAYGASATHAEAVGAGAVALVFITVDLALSWKARR